ncbi:NTE family protein [Virgibacillus halotolerans]|uniref:patatin-like phospholipase family protein n=1 Tax=Virgibacillus halotolerans TaxID=1071053 RepID=UPI001961F2B8|nr:patatin-like phospholipase family protein [Virgibacillus halotolerans]MBM7597986.1 NTE family protein [Virgibacillus halotolerans]
MKIDGVFSGGGVKAFAFVGALESIEEKQLLLERVAGTSAGAIVASLIAAGYPFNEIKILMDKLDLKQFSDPPSLTKIIPFSKWFFLYFQLGINKGDKLENWLYNQLAAKGIYTFSDLKPGYLKVIVSDLSLGKLVVIPDDLKRVYGIEPNYFPVSKAVRMSAGFPYFFMPKKLPGKSNKSIIVDGGLLSNFPLWVFEKGEYKRERPILGVKLTGSVEEQNQPRYIKNALDMFHALFSTMKLAHDARYISTSDKNNIIFIPVNDVQSMNFKLDTATKEQLFQSGRQSADRFLARWPT